MLTIFHLPFDLIFGEGTDEAKGASLVVSES